MRKQLNNMLIAILLTVTNLIPVHASPLQSHDKISDAVKKFILQQQVPLNNVQVTLTSLNKQLRLPQCQKALQISMAPGTKFLGNSTLSVRCSAPKFWKIHVAVHIDGLVDALIARYPIPRGTIIQNSDLEFVPRRYSQLNYGYYGTANSLINMEAKRNIKAGQIISPALVRAQKLVLRGQHITIIAQKGAVNLSVKGKALMDGQQGQTIKVRNLKSKKLIYARVVSSGIVKINF